jgi:hypothetical protein
LNDDRKGDEEVGVVLCTMEHTTKGGRWGILLLTHEKIGVEMYEFPE